MPSASRLRLAQAAFSLCVAGSALAARAPADGPRVATVLEIAPQELVAGATQWVDVLIRNGNDSYGASGTKLLQNGDAWRIDFGAPCVTQVVAATSLSDTLAGTFSVVTALPAAGSVLEVRFNGPTAERFDLDDALRVRVQLAVGAMSGDCALPPGDAAHPRAVSCATRVTCVSAAATFRPDSAPGSLAKACASDLDGPTGAAGPAGAQGPTGALGVAGPAGPTGSTGSAGAQGPTGSAGSVGSPGTQGSAGPTGAAGPAGATGVVGPTGETCAAGPAGPLGATGPQGPEGEVGAIGAAGPTGGVGPTGAQGPQGPAGVQGDDGPQGEPGAVGATGGPGPFGATGVRGPTGAVGATGLTGFTGSAGTMGPVGPTGLAGASGAVGPIGFQGVAGRTGPTGAPGPDATAPTLPRLPHVVADHPAGMTSGTDTSVILRTDALPFIVADSGTGVIRPFSCTSVDCATATPGGSFASNAAGGWPATVMGAAGLPLITWSGPSNQMLGGCADAACATLSFQQAIGQVGSDTSAVSVGTDGFPIVGFIEPTRIVRFVDCHDATCASRVSRQLEGVAYGLAMTLLPGSGLPRLSFVDDVTDAVRVIACSDASCAFKVTRTLYSGVTVGASDIGIARNGMPFVVAAQGQTVSLSLCTTDDCGISSRVSLWTTTGTPSFAATVRRDGLPSVAIADPAADEVRIAHCPTPGCGGATTSVAHDEYLEGVDLVTGADGRLFLTGQRSDGTVVTVHLASPFGTAWAQGR